jgi:hypothetical protein
MAAADKKTEEIIAKVKEEDLVRKVTENTAMVEKIHDATDQAKSVLLDTQVCARHTIANPASYLAILLTPPQAFKEARLLAKQKRGQRVAGAAPISARPLDFVCSNTLRLLQTSAKNWNASWGSQLQVRSSLTNFGVLVKAVGTVASGEVELAGGPRPTC